MNENLKVFLASLIIYPVALFGIFLAFITAVAFVTWDWYHVFHNVDFLLAVRVCCIGGWVMSTALGVFLIKDSNK